MQPRLQLLSKTGKLREPIKHYLANGAPYKSSSALAALSNAVPGCSSWVLLGADPREMLPVRHFVRARQRTLRLGSMHISTFHGFGNLLSEAGDVFFIFRLDRSHGLSPPLQKVSGAETVLE